MGDTPAPVRVVSVQPFRPTFLDVPGEPVVPWNRWHAMFEDYLLAVDFPVATEQLPRKAALLRASLGIEGYRVMTSLMQDPREPYDQLVQHLTTHFDRRPSLIFERAVFTRRVQSGAETVAQFVTELREKAAKCGFAAAQVDERVRDQMVAWLYEPKMRERLLQEPDNSTLEHMVQLATTLERSAQEGPALGETKQAAVGRVGSSGAGRRDHRAANTTVTCFNCGREGHRPKSPQCPAMGKTCSKCNKLNHFAKVCKSRAEYGKDKVKHADKSRLTNVKTVGMVSASGELKYVNCLLNGTRVKLVIDLGAKVSLISNSVYSQFFSHIQLRQAEIRLVSYDGSDIEALGCIRCSVQYYNTTLPNFTFHVTMGNSVMGVDLFDALGFRVRDPREVCISSVQSAVSLQQYPELLKSFGQITGYQHRPTVDLSVTPVKQAIRRLPLALRDEVAADIQRQLQMGLIEKADTPSRWLSNIVPIRKPDKKLRVCLDLTAVNRAIVPEVYPLPTMEELTSRLAGSTIFSKIDLRWGYLQVQLAEDSRYLTTFIVPDLGVFRYTRLCFGICSGPSAFQQIVKDITKGLDGCVNLLDDILVHSKDRAEHDKRLRAVLQRLSDHHATVNEDKTVLGADTVDFDGLRFSANGVSPIDSHTAAIRDMQPPANAKMLRSWLGATGYYMRFVPHYADIVEPLRQLLHKDAVWNWSPQCQIACNAVIDKIISATSLAHFNVSASTVVTTDASAVAIAGCLSQVINGEERPVAFASRALSPAERNYSATEREALAGLWACEKWHFYLYGRKFLLQTDHQALQTLFTAPGKGHRPLRLHRWADRLLQYNFDIKYRSGERIAMADYLSRMTVLGQLDDGHNSERDTLATISTIFGSTDLPVLLSHELQTATTNDVELQAVLQRVSEGWKARTTLAAELRPYHDVRETLSTSDDHLLMKDCVVVVPAALRRRVLELAHEGHPGIVKMKQRCRSAVWWPGMNADVESYVRHCVPCAVSGKAVRATPAPLQPIPYPPHVWHTIAIDIFGEVNWAPAHQRFLIVLYDLHSKWPEVATCSHATTDAIITFLKDTFYRHGLCNHIISDNGPQFRSAEFAEFLEAHGIQHNRTAVYNPSANPVERFNKVLKESLTVACAQSAPFLPSIKKILANYRSLPHITTGESPAHLMYGRQMRMPLDCLVTATPTQSASPAVQARVQSAQNTSKAYADHTRHAKPVNIRVGDFVRTLRPFRKHKLDAKWSAPKEVVRVNNTTLTLADGRSWNVRKCILHVAPEPPDFVIDVGGNTAQPPLDQLAQPPADNDAQHQQPPLTPPSTPLRTAIPDHLVRRGTRIRRQRVPYSPP
jgi:transposase InsO family protein